jgi:hypothetical protein
VEKRGSEIFSQQRQESPPSFQVFKETSFSLSDTSGAVEERDGDDVVFGVRVGVSSVVFCSPEERLRE